MNDSPVAPVFLESSYCYRRPVLIVAAIFFVGVAVLGTYWFIVSLFSQPLADLEPQGVLFATAWLLAMWLIGGTTAFHVVFRPTERVRIDAAGVTIGTRHWPWSEIDWIGGAASGELQPTVQLRFHRRGRWPLKLIRHIPQRPGFSIYEYEHFLDTIEAYLAEAHPHVDVG